MKTSHLHDIWAAPDNGRLVSKQFSFRFPVHIAAKIAALAEVYPQKNRTQIVADLLTTALDDLEKNLPSKYYEADPEVQRMQDDYSYNNGSKKVGWFLRSCVVLKKLDASSDGCGTPRKKQMSGIPSPPVPEIPAL